MKKYLPTLASLHPGFFRVCVALAFLHLGLGLDELRPDAAIRHATGSWQGVTAILPIWVWGLAHLSCLVLVIAGLYSSDFRLARWGFRWTITVCAAMAGSFLYGAFAFPNASLTGWVFFTSIGYVAWAAYKEPIAVIPLDGDLSWIRA